VVFLIVQSLAGLLILVQFNHLTLILGISSLALIAVYPFMKRITWWPQLFLGLAFAWGALIGWSAEIQSIGPPAITLYLGTILWVIGYDTIYALQDAEDDALIGVRSTAILFGRRVRVLVALFYAGALVFWAVAGWLVGAGPIYLGLELFALAILVWEVLTLDGREDGNALTRFRANHWVGLALTLALMAEAYF
jgi:4-hydroxybenzoate polyprenyltransferase